MTTAHIGNYGVNDIEVESDTVKIAGLVCKKFSDIYSRTAATGSLQKYLEQNNIVGISDIDTRALVRHIRDKGAMNAIISSETLDIDLLKEQLQKVPSMQGLELASKVSTKVPYYFGDENSEYKVAVLDFGVKKNILRCLAERNCYMKVFPYNTNVAEIMEWNPDGIMLSNGPGDPEPLIQVQDNIREILAKDIPVFGICLGHQLLSLSLGLKTEKMHNGHRGINHPVKNIITGKGEITSQNHGFVVRKEDALNHPEIEITHVHLNDDTLAGIRFKNKDVFSVQYHPEASPGPHDSRYLFDDFIYNMKKRKTN
jgi:carbamoyl-phosphate synthase small subunit